MSTVQVITITNLDQLSALADTDFLLVYDSSTFTWKRIAKSSIQLDMAVHNNTSHSTNFLVAALNLSDLTNATTARTNLGLQNTLDKTENLADLSDTSAARINLELQNTLDKTENLADLSDVAEAKTNLSLANTDIRTQGNYTDLTSDTILVVGNKYILRENVTGTLPTTSLTVGNEIEIVCGDSFGDTDVLDSFIDPDGNNIEGSSLSLTMTGTSFRLVWTGTTYGWSLI